MKELHPWQIHPSELIQYAIKHVYSKSEFDHRIGFLLLDFGVETILKTYLLLPQDILKSKISYAKRRRALELNFYELIEMVKSTAGNKLKNIDLSHALYFHSLRNIIYHEGSSISIDKELLNKYTDLGVELLKLLLSVDLTQFLIQTSSKLFHEKEKNILVKDINIVQNRLEKLTENFHGLINTFVEFIEPSFLSASIQKQIPIKVDTELDFPTILRIEEGEISEGGEIIEGREINEFPKTISTSEMERFMKERREKNNRIISKKLPKEILSYLSKSSEHKEQILEFVTLTYHDFLANFVRLKYEFMDTIDSDENAYNKFIEEVDSYLRKFHPWFIEDYNRLHVKEVKKIKLRGDALISKFLRINNYLEKNLPDKK